MNTPKPNTVTFRVAALVGAFSLIALSTSQAAFVGLPSPTPETPGVALGGLTTIGVGTVVAFQSQAFVDNALPTPFATGRLNSFVVDRGGGLLDFYYQVVNTSPGPDPFGDADFYRFKTTGGFTEAGHQVNPVQVAQTNSLVGLTTGAFAAQIAGLTQGAGLQAAQTADRDLGTPGSVGFDFPIQPPIPFTGDVNNVNFGESSSFLVVRTNSTQFGVVEGRVSGSATSFSSTFAAVPEPSSVLFGLAMFGLTLNSRIKSRRTKAA